MYTLEDLILSDVNDMVVDRLVLLELPLENSLVIMSGVYERLSGLLTLAREQLRAETTLAESFGMAALEIEKGFHSTRTEQEILNAAIDAATKLYLTVSTGTTFPHIEICLN